MVNGARAAQCAAGGRRRKQFAADSVPLGLTHVDFARSHHDSYRCKIASSATTGHTGAHGDRTAIKALAELCDLSAYFMVGSGPLTGSWRPVKQLYDDTAVLAATVGRVKARIDVVEQRVAASTFFLGFAARLWSIGVGTVVGYRMLVDLSPERLLFRENDGQITLHLEHPEAQRRGDLRSALADMVLDRHLEPLAVALRRLGPISAKLLHGNSASALLGAALVFDRGRATTSGWHLARSLCADQRLSAAVRFDETGYRRTSCCLYYRTPHGGLCGDCVLSRAPERYRHDRLSPCSPDH